MFTFLHAYFVKLFYFNMLLYSPLDVGVKFIAHWIGNFCPKCLHIKKLFTISINKSHFFSQKCSKCDPFKE